MSHTLRSQSWRAPVLFAVGLLLAAGFAVAVETAPPPQLQAAPLMARAPDPLPISSPRTLSTEDEAAAALAWTYIENNTRPETGWVDSVAGFPSTTLWDQGSYILGLISAHRLGLVEEGAFTARVDRLLTSFERLPLFEGKLPNKAYDTRSLRMVNYENEEIETGIGWSAIDMGRLLMAFRILQREMPMEANRISIIVSTWDLSAMTEHGAMMGSERTPRGTELRQEGRVGYEQYAARGAALWGLDVSLAMSTSAHVTWRRVAGVRVPEDTRSHKTFDAITPVSSDPYILAGLELGFDTQTHLIASQVYRAQEARFAESGVITMVSEDHIDQAPHFLYGAVLGNDRAWAVLSERGEHFADLRTVSLKSTLGWDALFGTEYTQLVRAELSGLAVPGVGWSAGQYEETGVANTAMTLNTNAIILESLHFKAFGPLWQYSGR